MALTNTNSFVYTGKRGQEVKRRKILLALLAFPALGLQEDGCAENEPVGAKVTVFIFEARIRSFAPGIEAAITLSEEQKKQLSVAYNEVFGTNAVRLAKLVLMDEGATVVQRQLASATMAQAEVEFRAKSREIFTEEQRATIDKVYEAFNRVYQTAEQAFVAEVTKSFRAELDNILTEEQKKAVEARRAEIEAARAKAADAAASEGTNGQ